MAVRDDQMACELDDETAPRQFLTGAPPSEEQTHHEHRAALDATLFRPGCALELEVVFELDGGELRLRAPRS